MMPTLRERKDLAMQFPDDVARMKRCLKAAGKQVEDDDVVYAWSDYSDTVCAEWLSLCEGDDALLSILLAHLPPAGTRWRIPITDAEDDSGAVIMSLPPALLVQIGWKKGDTLYVAMDEPGVLTVQRVD